MSALESKVSYKLVQKDIFTTFKQAEVSFEHFLENRDNEADMQACLNFLHQIRGTFRLLEFHGVALLCEALEKLATDVPVGAKSDKEGLLAALGHGLFSLGRYLEYLGIHTEDVPLLLLPAINVVRKSLKKTTFTDCEFYQLDNQIGVSHLKAPEPLVLEANEFQRNVRRFRHIYQVGLVNVLTDQRPQQSYKFMQRAMNGMARLSVNHRSFGFWQTTVVAFEALSLQVFDLTLTRKFMLTQIEKLMRTISQSDSASLDEDIPLNLHNDFLLIIALADHSSANIIQFKSDFQLAQFPISESELRQSRALFAGPGPSALRSVAVAVVDELNQVKEALSVASENEGVLERGLDIVKVLTAVSESLLMVKMEEASALLKAQALFLEDSLKLSDSISADGLLQIADALLKVESSVKSLHLNNNQPEEDVGKVSPNGLFEEARVVVLIESIKGLANSKRVISGYVGNEQDKSSLVKIIKILNDARGALYILEEHNAVKMLGACQSFIANAIVRSEQRPAISQLETLADALSSLEFYMENYLATQHRNESILEVAQESMQELGY